MLRLGDKVETPHGVGHITSFPVEKGEQAVEVLHETRYGTLRYPFAQVHRR